MVRWAVYLDDKPYRGGRHFRNERLAWSLHDRIVHTRPELRDRLSVRLVPSNDQRRLQHKSLPEVAPTEIGVGLPKIRLSPTERKAYALGMLHASIYAAGGAGSVVLRQRAVEVGLGTDPPDLPVQGSGVEC